MRVFFKNLSVEKLFTMIDYNIKVESVDPIKQICDIYICCNFISVSEHLITIFIDERYNSFDIKKEDYEYITIS